MIKYVSIAKAMAALEGRFEGKVTIQEREVDAEMRALGMMVPTADMGKLVMRLRKVPILLEADALAKLKAALGNQRPTLDSIRQVSQSAGLEFNHRQTLGALRQLKFDESAPNPNKLPAAEEVTRQLLDRISDHLGQTQPTEPSVTKAVKAMGIRLKTRDIRFVARHLNERKLQANELVDGETLRAVQLVAQKTGLLPKDVIHHSVYQAMKQMVLALNPSFDVDASDRLATQVLEIQFTAISPADSDAAARLPKRRTPAVRP